MITVAAAPVFDIKSAATVVGMLWYLVAVRCDMVFGELPNPFLVLALLPTAMTAVVLSLQGTATALSGMGLGAAAWAMPVLAGHAMAPDGVGFGDVKGAAAAGAVVGLTQRPLVIGVALAAALGAAAVTSRSGGRSEIALGPFLGGGMIVALMLGALVSEAS